MDLIVRPHLDPLSPISPSDSNSPPVYSFPELDFSACTSLKYLLFPLSVDQPQFYAASILPSISASHLFKVVLYLRWRRPKEDNFESWREVDYHLTRLAKRFKAANGGKKMEVVGIWSTNYDPHAFQWMNTQRPLPGVTEEATVVIPEQSMPYKEAALYINRVLGPPL